MELLRLGREELRSYGIDHRLATVTAVRSGANGFNLSLDSGERIVARAVLIATGVEDQLPQITGLEECYGISVHHCPYCDGWEVRDKKIAVLGSGASAAGLALSLRTWSDHIVVCTNRGTRLTAAQRSQLASHGIELVESPIARIDHEEGWIKRLVRENGQTVDCDALFVTVPQRQQSQLARKLGCEFNRRGTVKTDNLGRTCVPNVYVVGDASRDVQFVIVAAAEGAKAAVAINTALQARSGLALGKTA